MNEPAKKLSRAGKRQLVLMAAVGFLLMAVIMLALKVAESNAPPERSPKSKTQTVKLNAPGTLSDETVAAVNDRRLAELQATIKLQEREREKRLMEAQGKVEPPQLPAPPPAAGSDSDKAASGRQMRLFDPSKMGDDYRPRSGSTQGVQTPAPTVTTLSFDTANAEASTESEQQPRKLLDVTPHAREAYEAAGRTLRSGSSDYRSLAQSREQQTQSKTAETYLPSGTFFRVSTMNGMDAPAGGQAQNNPQPVLMVVSDWGNMPNAFRAEVKHCFVIGSAWGDLSSERAMARTESLSCIRPNGDVIDVPIAGFVVGPDGRNGFRGRVVTKQGQVLANALWTGMLGSFGDVASQLNSNPIVIAGSLATQQQPGTSDILKRSAMGGMGEAAKSLSQYYINLADKLYPVIETDAGLTAEVVLTRGVSVKESKRVGTTADLATIGRSLQRLVP